MNNHCIVAEYRTRIFVEVANMMHWFAGKQIRNVAVSLSETGRILDDFEKGDDIDV